MSGFFICSYQRLFLSLLNMNTLKNKKSINSLFESGKGLSSDLVFAKVLNSESSEFLFAVSSKKFKRAVDRNRIKRLMKESVRKLKIDNKNIAFIYIGDAIPSYNDINISISKIISKL